MNLAKINEIRTTAGLPVLTADPKKADQKKRQAANQAARAQACRDLRSLRGSGKKAKG